MELFMILRVFPLIIFICLCEQIVKSYVQI